MNEELIKALRKGFVIDNNEGDDALLPKILTNNIIDGEKVLTSIIDELNECDEFLFSVAFLVESGVRTLMSVFENIKNKNVKGTIIVSQYQNFTQPKALEMLLAYDFITLKIIPESEGKMHTKGYIFKKGDLYTVIIGSSNLTGAALCSNLEWNVKINTSKDGAYSKAVIDEFYKLDKIATEVNNKYIDEYSKIFDIAQEAREKAKELVLDSNKIVPNKMQEEALESIQNVRDLGSDRALVISATGTGKTILSAFDVKRYNPEKFLFIVHRNKIAKDALKSYKRVLGNNISTALMTEGHLGNAKYNFAMVQTLASNNNYKKFKPDEFDYILYDEVHHGGANKTYKAIFDYFKPKFMLGMTATPDRMDGFDVYGMFDHQVAYEIRLQDAMKEGMVCPFHYYGISELTIDGETIDDKSDFNKLVSEERINHIISTAKKFGYSGKRVKGLIFVSQKNEAFALSERLNQKGLRTVALTGSSSNEERESAIERLEQDENNDQALDYILTIDIFNEGVDIPSVNQIIMLRPTQSNIIFVQQLGRGLRLKNDKDYLVVIDFIGNYDHNFMIPMALSGSRRYNKDDDRKTVLNGDTVLPGSSTIYLDEIAKKRILASIDVANYRDSKILKESYQALKNQLGRIPVMMDFERFGAIDLMRIVENKNFKNYFSFVTYMEKENSPFKFTALEEKYLSFMSYKFLSGKRPHELELLKTVINEKHDIFNKFEKGFKTKYKDLIYTNNTRNNLINQFTQNYLSGSEKKTWIDVVFIQKDNSDYSISTQFEKMLNNPIFNNCVNEIIQMGLYRNDTYYANNYGGTALNLYEKYTYEDVCRLLDWKANEVALNIGGYKYDKTTNTFPVFINYDKADNISETIKYQDRFRDLNSLIAISKGNRTLESDDIKIISSAKDLNTNIYLFVRKNKNDEESKEFYFLGDMYADSKSFKEIIVGEQKAVEMLYKLNTPVKQDVYDYITKK